MDRAALVAALLAIAGCGEEPSFVTTRGVSVYLGGNDGFLERPQADEMEAWLVGILPADFEPRAVARCLERAEVRVLPAPFRCGGGQRLCAGEQRDRVLYVANTGCPWRSAYLHEIAHWLQQCAAGRYDPEHRERAFWQAVGSFPRRCDEPPTPPPG
jgi:hypothetical protein